MNVQHLARDGKLFQVTGEHTIWYETDTGEPVPLALIKPFLGKSLFLKLGAVGATRIPLMYRSASWVARKRTGSFT